MGKRSDFEPRPRGFYPTPWEAFAPLIPHLPPGASVIEPCAGDGTLCGHLTNAGLSVAWACDIEPQHPLIDKFDALDIDPYASPLPGLIVTNPPWPLPRQNGEPTLSIARHLSSLRPTWLLLPSDFMHNLYAAPAMRFCHKIVAVGRVRWIPGTKNDGYDNAAWYYFDQSHPADAIEFVPRQPKRRAAA